MLVGVDVPDLVTLAKDPLNRDALDMRNRFVVCLELDVLRDAALLVLGAVQADSLNGGWRGEGRGESNPVLTVRYRACCR